MGARRPLQTHLTRLPHSLPAPAGRRSVVVRAEEAAAAPPAPKPQVGPKRGSTVSAAARPPPACRSCGSSIEAAACKQCIGIGSSMGAAAAVWSSSSNAHCIQKGSAAATPTSRKPLPIACPLGAKPLPPLRCCLCVQVRVLRPESYWCALHSSSMATAAGMDDAANAQQAAWGTSTTCNSGSIGSLLYHASQRTHTSTFHLLSYLFPACRFRETGKVVSVDQSGIRYPVVVRFEKVRKLVCEWDVYAVGW